MKRGVLCIGVMLAIGWIAGDSREQIVRENLRVMEAVLQALDQLEGEAGLSATIDDFQFKTDQRGEVYMLYADGWQPVDPQGDERAY